MPRDAHVALSVLNKAARRLIVELLIIKRSHLKRFPHHAYVNVSVYACLHIYIEAGYCFLFVVFIHSTVELKYP